MKIKGWVFVLILLIAFGGYIIAIIQHNNSVDLQKTLLRDDVGKLHIIDGELETIRSNKKITVDELENSKRRIELLLDAAMDRDSCELSVEDALKILE